jgi:hypothetical protein
MAADIFRQVHKLHSGYAQAVSPSRSSHVCAACNTSLVTHLGGNRVAILGGGGGGKKSPSSSSSSSGAGYSSSLVLFGCGHTYHDSCLERSGDNESSSTSSSSTSNLAPICPQCVDRSVSSTSASGRLASSTTVADGAGSGIVDDGDEGSGGGGNAGGRNIAGRLFNRTSQKNEAGGSGGEDEEGGVIDKSAQQQHHIDDDGADPHITRLIRVREKNKARRSRPLTDIVDDLIAGGNANRGSGSGSGAIGAFKFSAPIIRKDNNWRINRVRPKDRVTKALNVVVMENSPFGS